MELLPGTFETQWERRRAALLHELEDGRRRARDDEWDWRPRGGLAGLPVQEKRRVRSDLPTIMSAGGGDEGGGYDRTMRARFEALARGSQPAVVKVTSYGTSGQAAVRLSYISRNGALTLETESGERISGMAALGALRADWAELFQQGPATRDAGLFSLSIEAPVDGTRDHQFDERVRRVLKAGLAERHFVYTIRPESCGRTWIEGVVVLRDPGGNRLRGDAPAAHAVQHKLDHDQFARAGKACFSFDGYGNGVAYTTARVRDLLERAHGGMRDETGRIVTTPQQASSLVRMEWRKDLHSRRARDFMHLVMSARAGTNAVGFNNAVREFLGEEFAGHRYVFATHDPADDPKKTDKGGKRPHIHAHAIVTMRKETGETTNHTIAAFRRWRLALADKARRNGIPMEMTDRRELASAPAFARNQVRALSYQGRTAFIGTSEAAQSRYDAKRNDVATIAGSPQSQLYAKRALEVWHEIAASATNPQSAGFASGQAARIAAALRDKIRDAATPESVLRASEAFRGNETNMHHMRHSQFAAYEKRVEAVLEEFGNSLKPEDRRHFHEIADAARQVVAVRREYLHVREPMEGGAGPRAAGHAVPRTDHRHAFQDSLSNHASIQTDAPDSRIEATTCWMNEAPSRPATNDRCDDQERKASVSGAQGSRCRGPMEANQGPERVDVTPHPEARHRPIGRARSASYDRRDGPER
jgi:hypothetical protein